ncbi:MAG: methyltransferase domain-containing protein, partial [Kiritimatiellae bacterium]|nr:methyltransferase domain-containing protein [Kiritimatiellia bacterium]
DRCAAAACAESAARYARLRAGVDAGSGDASVSQALRAACPGVWMTVEDGAVARARVATALDPKTVLQLGAGGEMPFDDHQFEVVVLSAALLSGDRARADAVVRETHRILQGGGCLVFSVDESGDGTGFSQRGVYDLLKDGFDVVGLKRPPWWKFGAAGRTLTVCARRKTWRRRSAPIVGEAMPVSSAMLSPRERKGGAR